jgi:hypothetical protein
VKRLRSPRFRARLRWWAAALVVAGGIAALVLSLNNSVPKPPAESKARKAFEPYRPERSVTFRGARRLEAMNVARSFVLTAVLRRHTGTSWRLVSDDLRRGFTQSQWARGAIPVVPYPAAAFSSALWKLRYSYPTRVALDVAILPKARASVAAAVFTMELVRDRARGWVVRSWGPAGGPIPPVPETRASVGPDPQPHTLSTYFLLIPVGLIGLIVLLPAAAWTVGWRRHKRAQREHYEAAVSRLPRIGG